MAPRMSKFAISAYEVRAARDGDGARGLPVAGRDSMLLNLSGAHGPFFTRNLLLLTDSAGRTGAGEVPGGERIRRVLEDARELVLGRSIAAYEETLREVDARFARRWTARAAARRPSTCARQFTLSRRSSARCSICSGSS